MKRYSKAGHEERVKARVGTRYDTSRKDWLKTRESLRALVAGDLSEVVGRTRSFLGEATPATPVNAPHDEYGDILVNSHFEGMSNHMRKNISILMRQVAFKSPDIQVENLDPTSALMHSLYLQARVGGQPYGCDAATSMEKALRESLTTGIGWATIAFDRGKPIISYARLEDINWDRTANTFNDIKWVSISRSETLGYWLDMFPKDERLFKSFIKDTPSCYDAVVSLEFYYDTDGEDGHTAVFVTDGTAIKETVEFGANPFQYQTEDVQTPFLPAVPLVYEHSPGVAWPTGIVDDMLPHQLRLWRNQRRIHDIIRVGKPRILITDGVIDPASKGAFLVPDDLPEVLTVMEGQRAEDAFQVRNGLDIPQSLMLDTESSQREIDTMAGVTTYAAGGVVPGVRFATEAVAINEHGDLNSQSVAAMYTKAWTQILTKYLSACILFDDFPVRLVYEDIDIVFGPGNPVAMYLNPNAAIIVQESGVQFRTPGAKLQDANAQLIASMQVAQMFPAGVGRAYEKVLLATGERNPKPWMEKPLPAPGASDTSIGETG